MTTQCHYLYGVIPAGKSRDFGPIGLEGEQLWLVVGITAAFSRAHGAHVDDISADGRLGGELTTLLGRDLVPPAFDAGEQVAADHLAALAAWAGRAPREFSQAFADLRKRSEEPVAIQPLAIQALLIEPLPSDGANEGR